VVPEADVKRLLAVLVAAAAVAAATAAPGGAADECRGIQQCIPVSGPWVVVRHGSEAGFLAGCGKHGVVGGLDAVATTSAVRVEWDARLGAPVSPGVSTTRSAFFRGQLVHGRVAAFQPWLGCIPSSGGGGRSTVSARVAPGAALERVARTVVVSPGEVKSASIACPGGQKLVGGWHALAFRTKKPPALGLAGLVHAAHRLAHSKVVVTVAATDALTIDAHAVVQVGAVCAP
jgi:hypothetical protein